MSGIIRNSFVRIAGQASLCAVLMSMVIGSSIAGANPETAVLRAGDAGEGVKDLQKSLTGFGLLQGKPDGKYGGATKDAVRKFQKRMGLAQDGIFGRKTRAVLMSVKAKRAAARTASTVSHKTHEVVVGDSLWSISKKYGVSSAKLADYNGIRIDKVLPVGRVLKIPSGGQAASRGLIGASHSVEILPWEKANVLFKSEARVLDIKTGISFDVRRHGGHFHADAEPATAEDAALFKRICGSWNWNRRAILITIGNRRIAASMNGMPHGGQEVLDNSFNGHFCIHFLGSKIHKSGAVDPQHQAMIRIASRY